MDWFSWENLHRKPWIFPVNVGFSCKFPAKTNPLNVRKKKWPVKLAKLWAVHGRDWWKQPIDATRGLLEIGKKYQTRGKRKRSKTGNACCLLWR